MGEIATHIPPGGLGKIHARDFIKGLYYACCGQMLGMLYFAFDSILQETPIWPTWAEWVPYLRAFLLTVSGYVLGKLGVNNVGEILKKNKPIVAVHADDLQEVIDKAKVAEKMVPALQAKQNRDETAP